MMTHGWNAEEDATEGVAEDAAEGAAEGAEEDAAEDAAATSSLSKHKRNGCPNITSKIWCRMYFKRALSFSAKMITIQP